MEASSTRPQEKKGVRKLWSRFKRALRSKRKADQSTALLVPTTTSSVPESQSQSANVSKNNTTSPELTRTLITSSTQPSEQPGSHVIHTQTSLEVAPSPVPNAEQSTASVPVLASAVVSAASPGPDSTSQPPIQSQQHASLSQSPVIAIEAEDDADDPDLTATETDPALRAFTTVVESVNASAVDVEKSEAIRRFERAQAIFKKYNMDFSEDEWDMYPKLQVERVHKAPRMRVRWTCHECKTTFGHDKVCVECAHQRCKECIRYPVKRKKSKTPKSKPTIESAATTTAIATTTPDSGTCHECQTMFTLGVTECTNCHHEICDRCLQETVARSQRPQTVVHTATASG